MDNLLVCNSVVKTYGSTVALNNFSLQIGCGKIVGLLGPNGCGKTTLIKIITGLLTPTKGVVLVDGKTVGIQSKSLISYLPDKVYFNDWMKVKDLAEFFADFFVDFDKEMAFELVTTMGIDLNSRLKALSKGTKEKVQLIFAMARRAKLYILDEPIAGVDPAARDYILHTILKNYNKDATIIIATHLISDIQEILDDVVFVKDGQVILHKTKQQILDEDGTTPDMLFREMFRC